MKTLFKNSNLQPKQFLNFFENYYKLIFMIIALAFLTNSNKLQAQIDTSTNKQPQKKSVILKNDGTEYIGYITASDGREVTINTDKLGIVIIPKHEIKEIRPLEDGEDGTDGILNDPFATRYFLTTNGLPIKKGESYILWNLWGPEAQIGIKDNFGVGIMTSWFAVPIVVSAKYSIPIDSNVSIGLGALLGTMSYSAPDAGGALPFASLTIGNRKSNISFSAGYGAIWEYGFSEGRALMSVAGLAKISPKISLVFDSFIAPVNSNSDLGTFALIMPGMRFQSNSKKAFQFGFAGLYTDEEWVPIPMLQWFRKL